MNSNRYLRLKAIKEFGYDLNWEELKNFHIGIIGIGGLGCITSEIACRCGLGKLTLFDFDTVEIVNLNRLMFKPEHIGRPKVDVAAELLKEINPDVEVQIFNSDIMAISFEKIFNEEIKKMDMILNGLDNIAAREYLNVKCISFNIPYIDAGASRSGLSGYIHPIIPHKTACSKCLSNIPINLPQERGEPCVASLPSTMAILASIQIQEMLKYLLKFGRMIDYMMYEMPTGKFHEYSTKIDPECPVCSKKKINLQTNIKNRISKKELNNFINDLKE